MSGHCTFSKLGGPKKPAQNLGGDRRFFLFFPTDLLGGLVRVLFAIGVALASLTPADVDEVVVRLAA